MIEQRDRYDSLLRYYGRKHEFEWLTLKAQMLAESNADPNAVSPVGAKGLTQFMPKTFREWWDELYGVKGIPAGPQSWRNPETAIEMQAAYMRRLLRAFGDVPTALAAYNWGWGRVRRHLREHGQLRMDKLPKETRDYVQRIDRFRNKLLAEL